MAAHFEFPSIDRLFDPTGKDAANLQKEFVAFAKSGLRQAISSGLASPNYKTFVNDHPGPEESVQMPGPITYIFSNWKLVIEATIEELKNRAPRNWTRFQSSFIVIADGRVVTDFSSIPNTSEVLVTNAQPFVRKVEAGAMGVSRFFVFDGAKRAMASRFNTRDRATAAPFKFETKWENLPGGIHPLIPYILKTNAGGRRKDRQAGMPITYPSIKITTN